MSKSSKSNKKGLSLQSPEPTKTDLRANLFKKSDRNAPDPFGSPAVNQFAESVFSSTPVAHTEIDIDGDFSR